jgi:hypothetical protein
MGRPGDLCAYANEPPRKPTFQAIVERAVELALTRQVARDVELARHRHSGVDVQMLVPSTALRLDFEGRRLASLVDLGRTGGGRCLETLG